MPLLLRSASLLACGVEQLPHDLLIDHAHRRPVRRDRQIDTLISQDLHQHPLQPQYCGALILLPAPFIQGSGPGPAAAVRRTCRPPIHHHRRDRLAVFVRLRCRHLTQGEGVFLPLLATPVLAYGQPSIGDAAAERFSPRQLSTTSAGSPCRGAAGAGLSRSCRNGRHRARSSRSSARPPSSTFITA